METRILNMPINSEQARQIEKKMFEESWQGAVEVKELPRKKRQYKDGHKGHDRFKEAIKLAQETYRQVKESTTLEQWQVSISGDEYTTVTWREVWRHIVSLALKGLIQMVDEVIKGGFLNLRTIGHKMVYKMMPTKS